MATLTTILHPIVGDRVIEGEGTTLAEWQSWQGLAQLTALDLTQLLPSQRVCIIAPHPDDEILGCGGLLQVLAARAQPIVLISVTNGTQSHPHSTHYPPEKLNEIRPQETRRALTVLGIASHVQHVLLELPDGEVFQQQAQLEQKLCEFLLPDDVVVAPFIHDGHPDHEATGQVAQRVARQQGLLFWQVLIWAWHWAVPADSRIPWHAARRLELSAQHITQKRAAIACFESQILPDDSIGQAPIITAVTIERLLQPFELYVVE